MALPALALWALTVGGSVEVWMVYALVFARGAVNAVDNPARQSFVIEMVGPRPRGQRRRAELGDRPHRAHPRPGLRRRS